MNVKTTLLLKSLKNVVVVNDIAQINSLSLCIELIDQKLGRALVGDRIHKPELHSAALCCNNQLVNQLLKRLVKRQLLNQLY